MSGRISGHSKVSSGNLPPRNPSQSLGSYVFEHLAEIEKLIALGIYQESICQQLTLVGFTPSIGTFKNSLARARARLKKQAIVGGQTPPQIPSMEIPAPRGNRLNADELAILELGMPRA